MPQMKRIAQTWRKSFVLQYLASSAHDIISDMRRTLYILVTFGGKYAVELVCVRSRNKRSPKSYEHTNPPHSSLENLRRQAAVTTFSLCL